MSCLQKHLLAFCFVLMATSFGCATMQTSVSPMLKEGKVLYQIGGVYPEYSGISEKEWQEIADSAKSSVDRIYALLVTKGDEEAMEAARSYLSENPGDLDGFEALVTVLYAQKKVALSIYHARYVLSKDSSRTHMWNLLGLSHVYRAKTLNDFRQAETYFERAAESSVSAPVAYLNLGFLHLEMGALDRAKSAFLQAEEACGGCAPSKLGLGITLRRQDDLAEAEKYLRSALKTSMPKKSRYKIYFHLALILSRDAKTRQEAINLLVEIVNELDSKDELHIKSQAVINQVRLNITS